MSRKVTDIRSLVQALEGPRKPEPEYEFTGRTFRRMPKAPGEHEQRYNYTVRKP